MKKKSSHTLFLFFLLFAFYANAQDTFSIVAVDPETGEVGSAGASCVELANFNLPPDFLGVLFPGEGAINSQAWYLEENQDNATIRFQAGDSPQEIIDWLVSFDVQSNATTRQYGVVRIENDIPSSAAHTGTNTDDYKGHRTGPTYSIQGNILLGPEILDSMEANFINTQGSLAHKLMAAMQGANVVGADARCTDNGTSSLFAFLKVAQPTDVFEQPSLVLGVDFADNTGIEPIDSLQVLFDQEFPVNTNEIALIEANVYPVPTKGKVFIELDYKSPLQLQVYDLKGQLLLSQSIQGNITVIDKEQLGSDNVYMYKLMSKQGQIMRSGKFLFFE